MLRERNTFVLKARGGSDERQHALTLHVNLREQDLSHFNGKSGAEGGKVVERLLALLDEDDALQALVRELDDLRQLDQVVKCKAKEGMHTLELPDVTVQWQVAEEPGLANVMQCVKDDSATGQSTVPKSAKLTGRYRPLPVRKLVIAVWMYPPHVEIPPAGERIPASTAVKQDFFVEEDDDSVEKCATKE